MEEDEWDLFLNSSSIQPSVELGLLNDVVPTLSVASRSSDLSALHLYSWTALKGFRIRSWVPSIPSTSIATFWPLLEHSVLQIISQARNCTFVFTLGFYEHHQIFSGLLSMWALYYFIRILFEIKIQCLFVCHEQVTNILFNYSID